MTRSSGTFLICEWPKADLFKHSARCSLDFCQLAPLEYSRSFSFASSEKEMATIEEGGHDRGEESETMINYVPNVFARSSKSEQRYSMRLDAIKEICISRCTPGPQVIVMEVNRNSGEIMVGQGWCHWEANETVSCPSEAGLAIQTHKIMLGRFQNLYRSEKPTRGEGILVHRSRSPGQTSLRKDRRSVVLLHSTCYLSH